MPDVDGLDALADPRGTAGEYVGRIIADVLPGDWDQSVIPDVVTAGVTVLLGGSLVGASLALILPEVLAAFTGGPTSKDIELWRRDLRENFTRRWLDFQEGRDVTESIVPVLFDLPLGDFALAQERDAFLADCNTARRSAAMKLHGDERLEALRQGKAFCDAAWAKYNTLRGLTPSGRIPRPSVEWIGSGHAQTYTRGHAFNLEPRNNTERWKLAVFLEELPALRFEQAAHMYAAFVRDSFTPVARQFAELDRLYGMGRMSPDDYKTVLNAVWNLEVFPGFTVRRFVTVDGRLAPEPNALTYLRTGKLPNEDLYSEPETRVPKEGGAVLQAAVALALAVSAGGK